MSTTVSGTFEADGSSAIVGGFKKARVDVGTDGDTGFGGGTIKIQVRNSTSAGWTTSKSITAASSEKIEDGIGDIQLKVELASSTSPDLDYAIVYE